ncbi:DUF1385 domain-containing protein [Risungbinella massiliensis]|uniref:DUF1385 domain-containing protein n=1 Tax=Risungbinella massiliensis TaxID=1329796 RepID=UPI0005CC0AFD|nr:DUF1385 domain-containing protein [Risungbinella massiliensis]
MSNKIIPYGGQAVIEGVMFGGQHTQVTAIRRKDGSIETFEMEKKSYGLVQALKKVPILRGLVALIESSALGAKHMQYASEKYELDEGDDEPQSEIDSNSSNWFMWLSVAVVGILSLVFGKVLFTALPAWLASVLFDRYVENLILQNLIEGAIKILLLLLYLWGISQTPMIKRVFQYHGAEHKVISTYESGETLTVENVQKQSTLHYRCGSSFIIFTVLVGVVLYSFFQYDNVWDRIWTRLILLPVVIGISYEVLRITNQVRDIPILRYLGYPGLWLQKLTTREPKDDQVEVAIAAFDRMRELDAAYIEQEKDQTAFVS